MKKPQNAQILAHLKRRKTITTLQAMRQYGICRLSERVRELKSSGHKIGAYWVNRPSRQYHYYLA